MARPKKNAAVDKQIETIRELRTLLKQWRQRLNIDPTADITLTVGDLDNARMEIDMGRAEYNVYEISVDKKELNDAHTCDREATLVHELTHILVHDLARLCVAALPDHMKDEAVYREEQLVERLSKIFVHLA